MDALLIGVFSGMAATILNLIYNFLRDKKERENRLDKEKRDYKMKIFSEIIGYRGQMGLNPSYGKNLEVAMNQVFIAFQDSPDVLKSFMEFKGNLHLPNNPESQKYRNDKVISSLVSLFKTMCDDLEIQYTFANDDLFNEPLSVGKEQPPFIIQVSNPQGGNKQ